MKYLETLLKKSSSFAGGSSNESSFTEITILPEDNRLLISFIDNLDEKRPIKYSFKLKSSRSSSLITKELNTDIYTLEDVVQSLKKPNLDPRDEMPQPILKSDVLDIEDLKVGMHIQGTVRNVVDFGAFSDIGLHNDGLAHISKLTNKYIKHPSEVVSVGDIVDCTVIDINLEKKKVNLSLIG